MNEISEKPEVQATECQISAEAEQPKLRHVPKEELEMILIDHKKWLDSHGKQCDRADLHNTDLRTANLKGVNLQHAFLMGSDLSEANLEGADLQNANLQNVNLANVCGLQEAKLKFSDLRGAAGLMGTEFAGNDLTGAILPNSIGDFKSVSVIEESSKNARKIFFAMLLGCVYTWLTIATTSDVQLLKNTASSPLPIIGTEIPIAYFYWVAPLIMMGLYFYFHLYLQRLWKGLATLPAKFPDGRQLDECVYPWLLSGIVRRHLKRLKKDRSIIDKMEEWISIILAWWTVPLSLIGLWIRYLPRHDWGGTRLHIGLFMVSVSVAAILYRSVALKLRGGEQKGLHSKRRLVDKRFLFGLGVCLAGFLLWVLSYGSLNGVRIKGKDFTKKAANFTSVEIIVPLIFDRFGFDVFADFRENDISIKPHNYWEIKADERLDSVKGANLKGKNLEYADMFRAFLVKANLRNAHLKGARLRKTYLQGADLRGADLRKAYLGGANLHGAILREAKFQGANLGEAILSGADLEDADFQGAYFGKTNLEKPDSGRATLLGANLRSVNLLGADGLTVGQLCEARTLYEAKLEPDLKELVDDKCPAQLENPDRKWAE